MPLNASPSQDGFASTLRQLAARITALETQQNFGVRDGSGVLRAQGGLLPTGDYGFSVTDPLSNTFELLPLKEAQVTTNQSTSSATFTDLATAGPSVTVWVGASGSVLIFVGAVINTTANTGSVGVSIDGGAPIYTAAQASGTTVGSFAGFYIQSGLTAKTSHTFKLQYESSSGSVSFANRSILVWPF